MIHRHTANNNRRVLILENNLPSAHADVIPIIPKEDTSLCF